MDNVKNCCPIMRYYIHEPLSSKFCNNNCGLFVNSAVFSGKLTQYTASYLMAMRILDGRATVRTVSCRSTVTAVLLQYQVCSGDSKTGTGFFLSSLGFSCQYHSTRTSFPFILLSMAQYIFSDKQRR
jgi:hypothetical protein